MFHERTKHIEINYHFVRENLQDGTISTKLIRFGGHHADILTKTLRT